MKEVQYQGDQPYDEAAKDQVSIMELEAVILRVDIDQSGVAAIRLAAVADRLKGRTHY